MNFLYLSFLKYSYILIFKNKLQCIKTNKMREKYCNGDYSSLVAVHSLCNSIVVSPALDLLIKKLHCKAANLHWNKGFERSQFGDNISRYTKLSLLHKNGCTFCAVVKATKNEWVFMWQKSMLRLFMLHHAEMGRRGWGTGNYISRLPYFLLNRMLPEMDFSFVYFFWQFVDCRCT